MQYQQGPPQQVVVKKKQNRGCLAAWYAISLLRDRLIYLFFAPSPTKKNPQSLGKNHPTKFRSSNSNKLAQGV